MRLDRYRSIRTACALVAVVCLCSLPAPAVRAADPSPVRLDADRYLQDYKLVTIDPAEVNRRVRGTGRVTIAAGLERFDLELEVKDLRAPNYRAVETLEDGSIRETAAPAVRTYAGRVRGSNAHARFTIDEGRVSGMILDGEDPVFVEPLSTFSLAGGPTDYVVYRASDVRPEAEPGTCGITEAHQMKVALGGVATSSARLAAASVVELATEADNEYVSQFGNAANANAEILSIVNQVDGVYQSEVGLTFQVVLQNTYAGADPYSGTNSSTMLTQFRNHWNSNFSGVDRDVAHMWTGRDMSGSTIGIAWVGVVCNEPSYSYGVSQNYTTATPQKYVLTAHEIGHNFGACHSNTTCNPNPAPCNNTIMQSFVGTGFTFCSFSRGQITSHASDNSSCLGDGGGGGGGGTPPAAPSGLSATLSSGQVNLSWADNSSDETGFKIERSTNGASFTQIGTAGAGATSFTDPSPKRNKTNTYRVRATNASGDSGYSNTAGVFVPR